MNMEAALSDFLLRIEHYQEKYQLLDEEKENQLSYMKIFNTGEKVVVHKHEGHIQSRIVYYLMNIHITPRTIYLTRVTKSLLLNMDKSYIESYCKFVIFSSMVKVSTIYMGSLVETQISVHAVINMQKHWQRILNNSNWVDCGFGHLV